MKIDYIKSWHRIKKLFKLVVTGKIRDVSELSMRKYVSTLNRC